MTENREFTSGYTGISKVKNPPIGFKHFFVPTSICLEYKGNSTYWSNNRYPYMFDGSYGFGGRHASSNALNRILHSWDTTWRFIIHRRGYFYWFDEIYNDLFSGQAYFRLYHENGELLCTVPRRKAQWNYFPFPLERNVIYRVKQDYMFMSECCCFGYDYSKYFIEDQSIIKTYTNQVWTPVQ